MLDFVGAIQEAKIGGAGLYATLADHMPSVEASLAVRGLASDETEHAMRLERVAGERQTPARIGPLAALACGVQDESWQSALMTAFALDQAATAALHAIARRGEGTLAETAATIVDEERAHQSLALAAFRSVAEGDTQSGRRLAAEMLVARDWVKQVFPRHAALAELAAAGLLPADAAKVHDSFLASLGDRVQEALGVLGD